MKEMWRPTLTSEAQKPYSMGGDIFMAEQGKGKDSMGVNEATRRIEMAAKIGEEARRQTSAREFLERNKDDLNVDVRRVLEEFTKESKSQNKYSDPKNKQQKAQGNSGREGDPSSSSGGEPPNDGNNSGGPGDRENSEGGSVPPGGAENGGNNSGGPGGSGGGEPPGGGNNGGGNEPPNNGANNNPSGGGGAGAGPEGEPQFEGRFWEQLNRLLNNEAVRRELESAVPDFSRPELEPLRKFIESLNPADQNGRIVTFAEIMTGERIDRMRHDLGNGEIIDIPEIRTSAMSRKVIFEWLLERIINIADTTPDTPYGERFTSFYITSNKANLLEVARRNLPNDIAYFGNLDHMRGNAHEFNRSLRFGDSYKEFVTQNLRSHGLDFIRNQIAGVSTAVQLYEKITTNRVSKTREWFNDGDLKAIDQKVNELFTDLVRDGSVQKDGRRLLPWEKERALRLARIFFAGTQRLAMYASFGDLPSDARTTDRIASLPYEYIARALVPWKMIAPRFFASTGGSRRYMDMIFREQEAADTYINLFGVDRRTVMMDTYGAQDPESHSWRSLMMFLGNVRINDIRTLDRNGTVVSGPTSRSLLEYLNEEARLYGGTIDDPVLGGKGVKKEDKPAFSRTISDAVLGQRLYLTVLARYGNLDDGLKTKIWQKIAVLKPSTLVSLCPEIVRNRNVWEGMTDKLYKAEMKRVIREGENMNVSEAELVGERRNFEGRILSLARQGANWTDGQRQEILRYMGMDNLELTLEEQAELESIIKRGVDASERVAVSKLPFTFAIDDAPVVNWAKTGNGITGLADEDVIRILISDQENFKNAWNEVNAQVESPQHVAQTIEHFQKAVKGIADVIGRETAQNIIEPFVTAWVRMVSTSGSILWTPGAKTISKLSRTPTSEMEKYFRNSFLSMDESERRNFLQALSQAGVLRDNPAESDPTTGLTQLDSLMERTKSTRKWSIIAILRMIMFLLGPSFAAEFLKTLSPKELRG